MEGLVWLLYALAAAGAVCWSLLMLFGRGWGNLSAAEFRRWAGLFVLLAAGFSVRRLPPVLTAAAFLAAPFAAERLGRSRRRTERDALRADMAQRAQSWKDHFAAYPSDGSALEKVGDIYELIGERAHAETYYVRALESLSAHGVPGDAVERKLHRVRAEPHRRVVPAHPVYRQLCACPGCGEILVRWDPYCFRCARSNHPGGAAGARRTLAGFLQSDAAMAVAGSGAVLLPFLFLCGEGAYAALWGLWAAAVWVSRW
jgi:hypothetical protein